MSPRKPDGQGSTRFHTAKPLEPRKRCIWLHEAPIRMSAWMMDDDPLAKIDSAVALSRK